MVHYHKYDSHFIVSCGFGSCSFVTKSWPCFKMHVKRKHQGGRENLHDSCLGADMHMDDYLPPQDINDHSLSENAASPHVMLSAAYLISLEAGHKLTRKAVDTVVDATSNLLASQTSVMKQDVLSKLNDAGFEQARELLDDVMPTTFFQGLETHEKRIKFYRQNFNLVEPMEVYFGHTLVKSKGKLVSKKHFGVIVPFEKNLQALLSMPEVWHNIQNVYTTSDNIMRDVCDGFVWAENDLYRHNPQALQIFLNTDDIEIVNPIGAHVKKHKLTMFYFTLGNVPPQYRSKLSFLQLLAIAKTKDVRKFGVHILLRDFLGTIGRLATGGITLKIHGREHLIEGTLLLVFADTPAAHWLGGFKEGVGFSKKICRCCDASAVTSKVHFSACCFSERTLDEHITRCDDLETLSSEAFKYWSRQWGINSKSCLCTIPYFDLISSFIQDPMHLFLEGVIPYELKLFLHFCIFEAKLFTVEWINVQLNTFLYSYMETDKPEMILKRDLLTEGKLKQTSGAVLTLVKILPYIVGAKVPTDCDRWTNFLRLLQIAFLCTSPIATADTAGQISQLVSTHHILFREQYPKASITPKMHYLVHLPKQLLKFGPLRNHWCLRFEGKHAFFKSFALKCFKNLPLTLARKHQLWMCYKQLGTMGSRNRNYLYEGDIVSGGVNTMLSDIYPSLLPEFTQFLVSDDGPGVMVYKTQNVKINGIEFRPGCVLVMAYDDTYLPDFVIVQDIFVCNNEKFFVCEHTSIDHFKPKMLCYVLALTSVLKIVRCIDLRFPWPLSAHRINGQLCVINITAPVCEFLA